MKTDIETLKKNVLYPMGLRREEQIFDIYVAADAVLKLMPLKHLEKSGLEETSGDPTVKL